MFANGLYSICSVEICEEKICEKAIISTYSEGMEWISKSLINYKIINDFNEINAIGYRIVSGGNLFNSTIELTDENIEKLNEIIDFAPMHIPNVLECIETAKKDFVLSKYYAVFDNLFHNTIDEETILYAVPYKWYKEYGIKKYGAHGLSFQYVAERCDKLLEKKENVIICHLGQGSSICALKNLKSIDTSMGVTPLEGIPMGTRCGSIDPSILKIIMKKEEKDIDEIFKTLNFESGLYGISNKSSDLADIINSDLPNCKMAVKVLVRRIIDYIGSYYFRLNGLDALIFTGGLGVKCSEIRELIIEEIKCVNIKIDKEKNDICSFESDISSKESEIKVYVIPSDEEYCIYKEVISGVGE